jgi:hypothetical protein
MRWDRSTGRAASVRDKEFGPLMRVLTKLTMVGASAAAALLTASAAHAAPLGATDDGAGSGIASLTGPIVAPVEADSLGAAGNAAQHVNANVCDVNAAVLGSALPGAPRSTDCTAASTSGGL